ncbi:RNA polymerase sigma factor [Cellvibrio sp. PSBB023]|uniref:RNA polymerase sigma factor n=1 Tax=Cellvibrio sp. PSBB023 TaxID=1945512 RepID=UPI0009C22FEE|nr:RNA polymerase sigma factor [Cellvibrio sp. PSBB023]AQT58732.1 RNA polymerase subunit sigma-24 [Cellvibrio sp. PSBB023]
MTDADHPTLIRHAQAGDGAAFAQLLAQHYDTMFRFAYRWCGHRSDAEDITQLACIKLAQSIGQFRFEAAFSSWLYRLVINCAKDWHKSQQRHQYDNIDNWIEPEQAPDQRAENSIYLQQLLHLLDQMAEGFKETALLVHGEGLSHAEAAEVLHLKESTVSWRLHEIRKQLQRRQQDSDGSWEPSL